MNESGNKVLKGRPLIDGTAGLAAHLGISRWTVSRILNGHDGIKEETRRRVLEAMKELGFEPNRFARGLRGMPSGLVGISIPHLEAMVLARKSQALSRELRAAGYRGIFEMPDGDPEMEEEVLRHFISIQVEGVVLIGSRIAADSVALADAVAKGIKVVALDPVYSLPVATIRLDRQAAMARLVELYYRAGQRRFGLLGIGADDMYGAVRLAGLQAGAAACGLDFNEAFRWYDADGYALQDYRYGATMAEQLLAEGAAAPRALIALNDRIAIGAMRTLQAAGKRVPEDFELIGFDNTPEAGWSRPALSTVDQNIPRMMVKAVKRLLAGTPKRVPPIEKIPPLIELRDSTVNLH